MQQTIRKCSGGLRLDAVVMDWVRHFCGDGRVVCACDLGSDSWGARGSKMWGRVMDPIVLLFVFGIGFAVGYGVRERKSRKRRRRYIYLRETADEAPDAMFPAN